MVPGAETLFADTGTEITFVPGASGDAIVSFAGIGLGLGGLPAAEFSASLSGAPHDVYFVKELTRSWYNTSFAMIAGRLNAAFSARGTSRVGTLGNSMGGFGALIFAGALSGCDRAVAFAPQSAADPAIVPWETRWRVWRDPVAAWSGLDAARLYRPGIRYEIIMGGQDPLDARHLARLTALPLPSRRAHVFAAAGHDVAAWLKRAGRLRPCLGALLLGDGEGIW